MIIVPKGHFIGYLETRVIREHRCSPLVLKFDVSPKQLLKSRWLVIEYSGIIANSGDGCAARCTD